ncbi:SMC-Scp complex subunit ScpB [Ferrovibrio xuzhouensis]|uniref:SMC-Scp complex subunit ScpB n=1 Tax=Ferrovibrio xuzhouensis TaxID=1576914 RepID=A0ABV7VIZ9_9PROT
MSNDAVPAEERLEDETEMTVAAAEVASEQDNAAPDFADDNADDESVDAADESGEDDAEAAFAGAIRMAEALLFAAAEPLDEATLRKRLPPKTRVPAVLAALEDMYRGRGVILKKVAGRWAFMTAPDMQHLLEEHRQVQRKLSRAAIETLAIIAYHQPVTRAEIEDIRGVGLSRGTLDVLMEADWIKVRGRRRVPGRPVTWGTTDEFLVHFGLESADALPGIEELRAAGLLEALPASGGIPMPGEALDTAPEDPLGEDDDGREFLEPLIVEAEEKAEAETAEDNAAPQDDDASDEDGDDDDADDDDDDSDDDDDESDDNDDEDDDDYDEDDDEDEDSDDDEDESDEDEDGHGPRNGG